jgi:5-methyltetrahydrofolate corrinoid/iron sulfur protein methyltransferase
MIVIADNLQGYRTEIRAALDEEDPLPVKDLVARVERAGARMIDINPGPLGRDSGKKMEFLVRTVQEVSDLPVLIDTADPEVMQAGLTASRTRSILNGFSLEPRKMKALLPLAARHDVDAVGYLLDPKGQPPVSLEDRLGIAVELDQAFRKTGLSAERLVIDPVVSPLLWGDGHRRNQILLEVLRELPEVLGRPVKTVAGLSNLTSGSAAPMEKKRRVEKAFLAMMAAAGLDMLMMNVFHRENVCMAGTCGELLSEKIFAWETI